MSLRHIDESLAHAMLAPLASWALSTLDPSPPKLVGVEAAEDAVTMHVIELDRRDPLDDLAGLVAPDAWDAAVIVSEATALRLGTPASARHVQVAHAVDRRHHGATEYRSRSGTTSSIRRSVGLLDELCRGLFEAPPAELRQSG